VIVEANTEIDEDLGAAVQLSGLQKVRIRSALTCESRRGICVKCYGRNLATGNTVEIGRLLALLPLSRSANRERS
jgi:DNA-directed RNA polymerase subunit beta'